MSGCTSFYSSSPKAMKQSSAPLAKNAAVVIGNEGAGAGETLKSAATLLSIPMEGRTESLNAAIAGSIIMYESMRQRKDGK